MNGKTTRQDDARYKAVEQKIRTAFYELLEEKGFQKTTVRMIVERAGINRSTFYLHYQDKYDLLTTIEEELSGGIVSLARKRVPHGFDPAAVPPMAKEIAQWVWENRAWIAILDGPNGDPGFLPRHTERMRTLMYGDRVRTVEEEYLEAALIGMVQQIIRTWIRRGFAESPEEFIAVFMKTGGNVYAQIGSILTSV